MNCPKCQGYIPNIATNANDFHQCPAFTSPDPLAQIAESLTRLADIAELKLRDGWTSATDTQTIKEIIAKYPRVVISPKEEA